MRGRVCISTSDLYMFMLSLFLFFLIQPVHVQVFVCIQPWRVCSGKGSRRKAVVAQCWIEMEREYIFGRNSEKHICLNQRNWKTVATYGEMHSELIMGCLERYPTIFAKEVAYAEKCILRNA